MDGWDGGGKVRKEGKKATSASFEQKEKPSGLAARRILPGQAKTDG